MTARFPAGDLARIAQDGPYLDLLANNFVVEFFVGRSNPTREKVRI